MISLLIAAGVIGAAIFGHYDMIRYWRDHPNHAFHPARRPDTDRDVIELLDAVKWGIWG